MKRQDRIAGLFPFWQQKVQFSFKFVFTFTVGGAEKGASTPQFSPGSQGPRGFTPTPQWSRSGWCFPPGESGSRAGGWQGAWSAEPQDLAVSLSAPLQRSRASPVPRRTGSVGEIAFQLDWHILAYVFPGDNPAVWPHHLQHP